MKDQVAVLGKWLVVDIILALGMWVWFPIRFSAKLPMIKLSIGSAVFNINNLAHMIAFIVFAIIILAILFAFSMCKGFAFKIERELVQSHFLFLCVLAVAGSAFFSGFVYNKIPLNYYSEDLSHYELEARYFLADKNSWEIDDYTDERFGSSRRDDHGPLWIAELVDPWLASDIINCSDAFRVSNFNLFYLYMCCNVLIFFTGRSVSNNSLTGIISIMLFDFYLHEKFFLMQISRDSFRYICLLLLFLYVKNVIYKIIDEQVNWKHFGALALFSLFAVNGHTGNVYIMFGLFLVTLFILITYKASLRMVLLFSLSTFVGSIIGISKTISLYCMTGRLHTSSLDPFYGTPVVTQLQNHWWLIRGDWGRILNSYTTPIMVMIGLGLIGLLFMIGIGKRKKRNDYWLAGLLFLGALLPLTGCLDWIGYKYSLWVVAQPRYRMSFLIFFALSGSCLLTVSWKQKYMKFLCSFCLIIVLISWWHIESLKYKQYSINYVKQCKLDAKTYKNMATKISSMVGGNAFMAQQPMLYYFSGTPKLLSHVHSKPLMQSKNYDEIKEAITMLKIGAIILPASGEFAIDYTLLPFWSYINDEFICYYFTEYGQSVIFVNPEFMKNGF